MVCVVIPIYKVELTQNETKSLKQCFSVLGAQKIIFVCSNKLDFSNYLSIITESNSYSIETFDDHFFQSITGYNNLLLSLMFYKRFSSYTHMLIYQLDAWVFKDELDYWCEKGFAYIGAPWFEGWDKATANSSFIGVGNGGFSLRNIKAHLRVLRSFHYIVSPKRFLKTFLKDISAANLKNLFVNLFLRNNTFYVMNKYEHNEDLFWGMVMPNLFNWYHVPDLETALQFAIEVNPSLYITQNSKIPFGCHAWEKYEPEFWGQFIF